MSTYIVSRHPGAVEWVRRVLDEPAAQAVEHLEALHFTAGDKVCGVLPLNWAARICAAGAEAHVITVDMPPELRGKELDAETLVRLGARLVRYEVRALN